MADHQEKTRNAASKALIALRKSLGKTQQTFAVEVLETAIGTVARYETSDPPRGEVLLRLRDIANEHGLAELGSEFDLLYREGVLNNIGPSLAMVPATETEPARGILMLRLSGDDAIRGAHAFMGILPQLGSNDPKVKQNALSALELLQRARRKFEGPGSSATHEMMLSLILGAHHQPTERENKGDATASASSGHHVTGHPRDNPEQKQEQAPAMRKTASRKKGR